MYKNPKMKVRGHMGVRDHPRRNNVVEPASYMLAGVGLLFGFCALLAAIFGG